MAVRSFADVDRELLSFRREVSRLRAEDRLIRQKLSHAAGSSTIGLFYASNPSGEHWHLSGLTDPDHPQYFYLAGELADAKLFSSADLYLYSDAGSSVTARLYGASGNFDLAGDIEFQADDLWIGRGSGLSRIVFTTGSEASLRSAADLAIYSSSDTSTERLRLYGSTGNIDLDGDIEFQVADSWIGLGAGSSRAVFTSGGSEMSLRSAADFAWYATADTSTEKARVDGATGSFYAVHGAAVGINAGARLVFSGTPSPDEVQVTGGDLRLPSGLGIIHVDGNEPGRVLIADGTRYVPGYVEVGDISNLSYATPNLTFDTVNAVGVANSVMRSDAQIALFSTDNPSTITAGDSPSPGAGSYAARYNHVHGITSSSNPGAAAALIATAADGGVQLLRLGIGIGPPEDNRITMVDGASIGAVAGVLLTFDNSSSELQITQGAGGAIATLIGTQASPSFLTQGLVINQGDYDDSILMLKATEVGHGMTTYVDTDAYGRFTKVVAASGGLNVDGWSEATVGLMLGGMVTTNTTTKTTSSDGHIVLRSYTKNGTDITSVAANGNLVVMRNAGTTRWILDAEGDIFYGGSDDGSITDDYDDVALLTGLRALRAPSGAPIRHIFDKRFTGFLEDAEATLVEHGVLTAPLDKGGLISRSALDGLIIDALRQLYGRIEALERP
jgi:hypothetical protein